MSRPARLMAILVAFSGLSGLLGASASGTTASMPITLEYTVGGVLEVITADGTVIRTSAAPGAVISPGAYQVIVNNDVPDSRDIEHLFLLQGPGVNLQTDMAAGDDKTELFDMTLAPNSTYTFSDSRQPNLAHVVFSTASTASTSSGSSGRGASTGSSSGTSNNSGIIGSGLKASVFRGNLAGSVGATGKLTLTAGGTKVLRLLAGRYRITVADTTAKRGFTLQEIQKPAIALTGRSFVGKRTVTVDLKAGRWMFYSSSGDKSYFTVLS